MMRPTVAKDRAGDERRRLAPAGIHLVIRDFGLQQRADPVEHLGQLAVLERAAQEV